jgi:hypothetical protein
MEKVLIFDKLNKEIKQMELGEIKKEEKWKRRLLF